MLITLNPKFVRKGLLPLLGTIVLFQSIAVGDFWISGSLPEVSPDAVPKLFRESLELKALTLEGKLSVDSEGNFNQQFDGEPGLFSLAFPGDRKISLAIDEGQRVVIQTDIKDHGALQIAGSPDTDALIAYESFRKESLARLVYPPRAALNEATARGASAERLAALSEQEVEGYAAHRRELNDFTIEQIGKSVALYATSLRWDPDYRLSELENAVKAFSENRPQAAISKRMIEKVQSFRRTAIGANGASLAGKSLDGKSHRLEDSKGQYVLVDFWASWCVPCRVENRHYIKLLDKHSNDNFTIFAINLDDSRSVWEQASKRDRVTWPQISDSLGWDSPMAAAYNVNALPMSFLLNPEGRIIARNLRGAKLEAMLAEIFK